LGKEILRAFFLWKNGIEWLGFFAYSTLLLSLLLGKLAFYLMDLLRCVVIVTYLFFLSRGEDTRASASCPSNTTSKQAVRVVRGKAGIPISGLKFSEAVGGLFYLLYY